MSKIFLINLNTFFRSSFNYDRLTISIRKETKNRRKIDKSINSIVKLTDGIKDELDQGTEFPTNGTLHGSTNHYR